MQLIAVGDTIINLDNVTALDVDLENNVFRLKVLVDSNVPVATSDVGPELLGQLLNLVPQHLRFRGRDT